MFRQEKDFLPFNEIAHLTGESLRFSVNLRKRNEDTKLVKKKVVAPSPIEVKPAAPAIDMKKIVDEFAVKETNCVVPLCLHNNQIYLMEFQERLDLLAGIEAAEAALEQQEALLLEAAEQYKAALQINHDSSETFNELGIRDAEAKARRNELYKEQIKLDQEIRRTEKEKAHLEGIQHNQVDTVSSEVNFTPHKKAPHTCIMKHNGVYRLNLEGVFAWTCCSSLEKEHAGCAEDHSVHARSSLPIVKNFYTNQLRINHPLQHGSSLFFDNNVKFNLQLNPSTIKNETNQDTELANHNHTSSLFLGKGSAIDYFSVNKPATRVAAMEPYANKSIRSTSRLVFGVPAVPPNVNLDVFLSPQKSPTLLGTSQSQVSRSRPATASGPLQRSSIAEVFPHLDTKIRRHQVEQRFIAVDFSKPPVSDEPDSPTNHDTTRHYALYSRPYAHTNVTTAAHGFGQGHGLLTQSHHALSQSLTRPFSAHASCTSAPNFNASMMSNASWGQALDANDPPTARSTHSVQASHASQVGHNHRGDDLATHRDDAEHESTSEPEVHSAHSAHSSQHTLRTTHPTPGKQKQGTQGHLGAVPHYAQAKTAPIGHKTLIGKQRAVPERVKLTGNRPLTSVKGYDLYST